MMTKMIRVKCQINHCSKPVFARGYCQQHYTRFYKYGDPLFLKIDRETSNIKKLSGVQLGYLVGLIEGEGTIGLSIHSKGAKKGQRWDVYLKISNTNKELLENLRKMLGSGRVKVHDRKAFRPNRKPEYALTYMRHSDLQNLLEQTMAFLIVKKRNAELMLEYLKLRKIVRKEGHKNGFHFKREYEIFEEFKGLNKRGKTNVVQND